MLRVKGYAVTSIWSLRRFIFTELCLARGAWRTWKRKRLLLEYLIGWL